jgi:hypothetical protein
MPVTRIEKTGFCISNTLIYMKKNNHDRIGSKIAGLVLESCCIIVEYQGLVVVSAAHLCWVVFYT